MASWGTFFELGGRGAMEALGHTGLDYVIIDTEHGCFSEETTADLILAAERHGLTPLVRIGSTQRPYVLRMLDIGARGLIVPNIRTIDQVRELVDAAKFPPVGRRGFCPNRTSGWGSTEESRDVATYMELCNQSAQLIPQCETRDALENIEEIAALDGVDGIFVGPFDLSVDLGIPLQLDHPVMQEAIGRILAACKASNKRSYIFAGTVEDAVGWARAGFDSVTYGLDASVLANAYRAILSQINDL